jgi:hypothetical protein
MILEKLRVAAAGVLGSCVVMLAQAPQSPPQALFQLEQTVLGTLPGTIRGPMRISPRGRHVYSTVEIGAVNEAYGEWALYRDGALVGRYEGKLPTSWYYPETSEPGVQLEFSADGEHYAFIGERNGKQFIVHDGAEGPPYDELSRPLLSSTGERVAYVVGHSPERRLIVDNQVGPAFDDVGGKFSPDGRHFVSTTSTGVARCLFLDGAPQIEPIEEGDAKYGHLSIVDAKFSPDSQHLAFVTYIGQKSRVILDGKTVGSYPGGIDRLTFSADSRHLTFETGQGVANKQSRTLVVDGVAKALGDTSIGLPFLAWSSDGRHLAYAERRDNRANYPVPDASLRGGIWPCPTACWRMVLDGKESPAYYDLDAVNARFLTDGRLVYSAFDGKQWITRIGDERIEGLRMIAITPDGAHRAFAPDVASNPFILDGTRFIETASSCCFPRFSGPAGKHLVHGTVLPSDDAFVAIDGIHQPAEGAVLFTSDENHYALLHGNDVAVDGVPIPVPGVTELRFSFDGSDRFHVFARVGNRLVRVDGRF